MIEKVLVCKKDFSAIDCARIVQRVRLFDSKVKFKKKYKEISADSILDLLRLNIHAGDEINVKILGRKIEHEDKILIGLESIFECEE